mmetsp:Transcript_23311/g.38854  ORF Transcript_23311/g.38854 Transcript_23311/m.38854 type:complete len:105 (-) Transcript_23311:73-387(-)|eukprot:CAMPEP_0174955218 /NCGR_PEP_ID=MMETSP0004_2-20121128/863_1 /TAXON_ID=420556 /ORGANISM="Ochromonas sp., Strain CCMP1393" /LENGTH=104 /DNA_ID=CAMNT_0016203129 /DNA_START=77 /DNA_END=391 /DNA_ORIENTATION=+
MFLAPTASTAGGFGDTKEPTADEQAILDGVQGEVEAQLSKSFAVFQAVSFITQVVAGVNYIFKVKCDEEIIHVKVCKPLPHTNKPPFVMAVDANQSMESPIVPI